MGYISNYPVGTKSFGLSCQGAEDNDNWRRDSRRQLANPGLPETGC